MQLWLPSMKMMMTLLCSDVPQKQRFKATGRVFTTDSAGRMDETAVLLLVSKELFRTWKISSGLWCVYLHVGVVKTVKCCFHDRSSQGFDQGVE